MGMRSKKPKATEKPAQQAANRNHRTPLAHVEREMT